MGEEPASRDKDVQASVKTILIVEDDDDIGDFLVQALMFETSFEVLRVPDAARALEVVRSLKPSLFILDYRLPGMNGLELYDRLHATPGFEHIRAVMITAELSSSQEVKKRGMVYVKKPFELDDLLRTLTALLMSE